MIELLTKQKSSNSILKENLINFFRFFFLEIQKKEEEFQKINELIVKLEDKRKIECFVFHLSNFLVREFYDEESYKEHIKYGANGVTRHEFCIATIKFVAIPNKKFDIVNTKIQELILGLS